VVGGDETILVVEDNEDLRELTKLQLERLGYEVLIAVHGAEALKILSSHPGIDLLLTDVVLPKNMNGPALAERACALVPTLSVIFMSGYNEQHAEIENAIAGRPMRLLQKPFHAETLAEQVRSALDGRPEAAIATDGLANIYR
jgi:CheY-like chemotaxis protein